MKALVRKYRRPAGAHRAVSPGPHPFPPAVDPWARYPLFLGHDYRHEPARLPIAMEGTK